MNEPKRPRVDHNLQLAAERTLLAWVRTGLSLMGFGFVVARFGLFLREMAAARGEPATPTPNHGATGPLGIGLVAVGVAVFAVAAIRFQRYTKALRDGAEVEPPGQLFGVVVSIVLALLGLFMAFYLIRVS